MRVQVMFDGLDASVVAGRECATRYFHAEEKASTRKLTSSMVALIQRESNKCVKPANAMAQ